MMDRCVLPRDFVGFLVLFVEILEKGGGDFWRGTVRWVESLPCLVPKWEFGLPLIKVNNLFYLSSFNPIGATCPIEKKTVSHR